MTKKLTKTAQALLASLVDRVDLYELFYDAPDGLVHEIHQYLLDLTAPETWLCPHGCGNRVLYGTACDACASRHEPTESYVKGLGISEIANSDTNTES